MDTSHFVRASVGSEVDRHLRRASCFDRVVAIARQAVNDEAEATGNG
jgi:hypothetical protein